MSRFLPLLALGAALAAGACRDASNSSGSTSQPILPPLAGTNGCNGTDVDFDPPPVPVQIPLALHVPGPLSQVAGARGAELLYLTGAAGQVTEVDLAADQAETVLLSPGFLDSFLSLALGAGTTAEISGLAVLDDEFLVVMEHSVNVVLLVSRETPDTVQLLAGFPSASPGFADGLSVTARFSFDQPSQLAPSGEGRLFIVDSGNHALRVLDQGFIGTLAGTGAADFADGSLQEARFDTPTGISVGCSNSLLVSERGDVGFGGHRIRDVVVGPPSFFGTFDGSVTTVSGDGEDETVQGVGDEASLAAPVAPVTSGEGELYFVDSETAVLRRVDSAGLVDCPQFADCASAVAGPFTPGSLFSLVLTDDGALFLYDADAGALWRINP